MAIPKWVREFRTVRALWMKGLSVKEIAEEIEQPFERVLFHIDRLRTRWPERRVA